MDRESKVNFQAPERIGNEGHSCCTFFVGGISCVMNAPGFTGFYCGRCRNRRSSDAFAVRSARSGLQGGCSWAPCYSSHNTSVEEVAGFVGVVDRRLLVHNLEAFLEVKEVANGV